MSLKAALDAELAALDAGGIASLDIHAHTGVDIDGTTRSCEQHVADLAEIGGRSVIFPLAVRGGYAAENRRVLEECRHHPETLVPFARLDPRADSSAEAEAALAAGARGFKLHPRAEDFRLDHPGVAAIGAVAADAHAPLLIHAGAGVGALGPDIVALAERDRRCPLILAHAGVSDLDWLGPLAAEHANVFFDTSWWNVSDLLALFALVPPGQILFGSDEPYMSLRVVLAIALRCARFSGLNEEALRLVFGGQAERLLAGEPPLDAGPPRGPAERPVAIGDARLATLLSAAGGCMLGGGDASQILELAGLAAGGIEAGTGEERELVAGLVAEATACSPEAPWATALALALLATPRVEAPALA